MLSQAEADDLIAMDKYLVNPSQSIIFPFPGQTEVLALESADGRERFQLDLERGGHTQRWKLQLRNRSVYILVRLEVGGPGHSNPKKAPNRYLSRYEGQRIPTPHLQRYVEGFNDGWATPPPPAFTNIGDVATTWVEFLQYCNIVGAPNLQRSF